ncbi:dihydroorotase, multifunctional complex type [Synechococcus sp. PCC 7502]|uniref:dihydroorotase n=1 Tax=Synechococcus sp. PCC 7502 TaxID=1173263 RepID=UPI00029F9BC4|nr:dihydroorotase [Synechococcus sp. PCC 7502]AFY74089.1 dihydroorotase, multifunctional complex type [Synechococcus sp. PCC 7502]
MPALFKASQFKQVKVIDAITQTESIQDILLTSDGNFQIGLDSPPEDVEISDRSGLILGTGLVDMYSHSGEPGFEKRETLSSLTASAKNGGFSQVGILPNTQPAIDNATATEFWRSHSLFLPWGGITINCEGKAITDLAELAPHVVGFSDGKPISNLALVRRVMEYVKPLHKPLMLWAWHSNLAESGVMREGKWSLQYGLAGIPEIAETVALASLLELVALTKTPTHFMKISTARSVELIAQAKNSHLPVTASVCWMNLWQSDQDLHSYDPNLRLSPPLGNSEDRAALINGIKNGTIDAIAVDHTPYTYEEKTVDFESAPSGVIGLELILATLWQELVVTEKLTPLELWQALSIRPAQCLNLDPQNLKLATLFDPNQTWTVKAIASLSTNTSVYGKTLTGKVLRP